MRKRYAKGAIVQQTSARRRYGFPKCMVALLTPGKRADRPLQGHVKTIIRGAVVKMVSQRRKSRLPQRKNNGNIIS